MGPENRGHPPREAKGHPPIIRATALALLRNYADESIQRVVVAGLRGSIAVGPYRRAARIDGLDAGSPLAIGRAPAAGSPAGRADGSGADPRAAGRDASPAEDRIRLEAGIAEYLRVQAFNDDRPESHTNRAGVHLAMGETVEAEAAFREALALQPAWIPGLVNLADLYRATNRDAQGGELLSRAARLAPESADVLLAYGLWMVRQNRRTEALQLFYRAANAQTATGRHAYVHAVALHSAGRLEDALDALDRGIDARPGDLQLLQTALGIARELGDSDRTERYRRQIQSLSSP